MAQTLNAEFGWPGGDRPGALEFRHDPPEPIVQVIRESLASSFPPASDPKAQLRALAPSTGPIGHYRLSTPAGAWFVRASSRLLHPKVELSITDYLAGEGVNVNPFIVAGCSLNWEGRDVRVDVRPILEGRHFDGSNSDLRNVSTTLVVCHNAFARFPGRHEVREVAMSRYRRHEDIRDLIDEALTRSNFEFFAEHEAWASGHRDWLAAMVEQFEPHLADKSDAQLLHGQLHIGNVIFARHDGAAVLVDFEESGHTFAPPAWDLAFMVQRFCLRDSPSLSVARQRLSVVAEAYGDPVPSLVPMMRQAAWFCIAKMVDLRRCHNEVAPPSEYEKFVWLERQARAYEGVV